MTTQDSNIAALLEVMRRLRDPRNGCPWDQEQDYRSIVPHTLEEAYEVADAIERGELGELRDELGDLLFQVVFYSQLGKEDGLFDFADVVEGIVNKLIRRHPHVFADAVVEDSVAQTLEWEKLKAAERAQMAKLSPPGLLAGISLALPAATRAAKLQRRAARVGFDRVGVDRVGVDWPNHTGVLDKLAEALQELEHARKTQSRERVEEEMGDVLFTAVNLARHLDVDPESALRGANSRFQQRFEFIESELKSSGKTVQDTDPETLEKLWQQAKKK